MTQNYLVIENNVVTNVCVWDGDVNKWTPPEGSVLLPQNTTLALVWVWNEDKNDCELQEKTGLASVGFSWNGTNFVTPLPKPIIE